MDVTAVVLHEGALAYYTVTDNGEKGYVASLLEYRGLPEKMPPQKLSFIKQGRHCLGDVENQELMDDIFDAVKFKYTQSSPSLTGHNPGSPYVSI